MLLTAPDDRTASLYRWVALLKSTKTHRPPEPHSHQGPGFFAACTAGDVEKKNVFETEE